MGAVAALHGGARRHRELRVRSMKCGYACRQQIERSWYAPDRIVNFRRAIQTRRSHRPGTRRSGLHSARSGVPCSAGVVRIFRSRKNRHKRKRSECMSGSPPENTTHSTRNRAMSSPCRSNSAALISRAESVFQMSHMTQRQLQRLCGYKINTGSDCRTGFILAPAFPQAGSSGPRAASVANTEARNVDVHKPRAAAFQFDLLQVARERGIDPRGKLRWTLVGFCLRE